MTAGQTTPDAIPKRSGGGAVKVLEAVVIGLASILVAGAFGLLIAYHSYSIPSGAMEPTIVPGDYVFASNFAYAFGHRPERGDIVLYRTLGPSPAVYIKRVVGMPGERIQLTKGVVLVDGKAITRRQISSGVEKLPFGLTGPVFRFRETMPNGRTYLTNSYGPDGEAENTGVYVVPSGRYFVLGDNRDNSADSRFPEEANGGYVPFENLTGRADVLVSRSGGGKGARSGLHIRSLK